MISPYRFEFKYIMSPETAFQFEHDLKYFGFAMDEHSPSPEGYWVTSLYFDSYDFKDYYDKSGGFLERKKIRARIYEPFLDASPSILLELKEKRDAQVLKSQLRLSRAEWQHFIDRGMSAFIFMERNGKEAEAKRAILWNMISHSAKPCILVRYRRKPYVASLGNLRITFDSHLEACRKIDLGYSAFMVPAFREGVILEIKAKSHAVLPQWLNALIRKYDLKKDAVSKYAHAVDAINEYNPLPR